MSFRKINEKKEKNYSENILSTDTVVIQRTLRSGQMIYYPGHVVLLGDVNPGAELTADGDIFIFGHLRGTAHAGFAGGEDAVVFAFKLKPTQLRIANHITRSPDNDDFYFEEPEIAFIEDEKIIITKYKLI